MRYTRLFGRTLRDKPRNADSRSHQLLLRAGYVRPAPGGGLVLLPLGERVLRRVHDLVREELEAAGVSMAGWAGARQAAGSDAGRNLRYRRREAGRDYPLAEHHEAALAMLSGSLNVSYRDLPVLLGGDRWATRDQPHPNWGLLGGQEFLLYAAYAFAAESGEAARQIELVRAAFLRVLQRVNVASFGMASAADSESVEFAIATDLNAQPILECRSCGYHAPAELAVSRSPEWPQDAERAVPESVVGPGLIQPEPLADFLRIPVHQITKTLLFDVGGRVVAACVPGVYDVSEAKLARVLNCRGIALADPDTVRRLTGAEVGYAGPMGLPPEVEVIWDLSTARRTNFEAGANRTDHHRINLNFGRDLPLPERSLDIRISRAGESCGNCSQGKLERGNAISIGFESELGEMYSEELGARYLDAGKSARPLRMACAAWDVTAVLAGIAEQNSDGRGLVWPASVAPFDAHLVSLPPAEATAEELYGQLGAAGIAVLWDDRSESAGVKFGDADLIGIPVRLVVSKRTGDKVEWKARADEQGALLTADEALARFAR